MKVSAREARPFLRFWNPISASNHWKSLGNEGLGARSAPFLTFLDPMFLLKWLKTLRKMKVPAREARLFLRFWTSIFTKIIEILTLREQWSQICRNFFSRNYNFYQFLKMIGFTQWCDVFSKQCEIARFTQWCEMFCLIRPRVKNCPFYPMVRRFFQ